VKESFILEIAKNVASHVEERLKPENLPDTEIKEVHLEELKLLVRLLAHFKSQAGDDDGDGSSATKKSKLDSKEVQ
jgi:hypothetical protein